MQFDIEKNVSKSQKNIEVQQFPIFFITEENKILFQQAKTFSQEKIRQNENIIIFESAAIYRR